MSKFEQPKTKIIRKNTVKVLAGTAFVATSLLGTSELASAGEVHTQSSVSVIAKELNEGQVVNNVVVEEGFLIPIKYNKDSIDVQPMAVLNPIKLGKDTYAFIVDNPTNTLKSRKIELHTFHYDKPLEVMGVPKSDTSTKRIHREIVTSIAPVYYPGTTSTGEANYFNWVTIGDKSGNVLEIANPNPGSASAPTDAQIEQQIFSMPYVASLSYYAPQG